MSPRPLELFDLPKLARYRDGLVVLDSKRRLTQGNPLRARQFLAHLNVTQRIYTGIAEKDDGTLLGGIAQSEGERFATLTYLTPETRADADSALALIEHLAAQAGRWQAHQVVAEVEENRPLYSTLRRGRFAVYDRQRIWDMSAIVRDPGLPPRWRKQRDADGIAIQSLQRQLVPPLLQQIESFNRPNGLLCTGDELLAYIDVTAGAQGIFLRPLIHPNTERIQEKLLHLLTQLTDRRKRRIYLCVRSYQAWIEPTLEALGATAGPRQAVMVKHLVNVIRENKTAPVSTDTAWAKPAAPIRRNINTPRT